MPFNCVIGILIKKNDELEEEDAINVHLDGGVSQFPV